MVADTRSDNRNEWEDNSMGIRRSEVIRPHRQPHGQPQPIRPLSPRHALPDPIDISKMETTTLGPRPVPNITPKRQPNEQGKRAYELKLQQDFAHGGYHAVHAVLGPEGGGEVTRQEAVLTSSPLEFHYTNTGIKFPFSFEEIIQLAACACDARGMSWADACRWLQQVIRDLDLQDPPDPPKRGA